MEPLSYSACQPTTEHQYWDEQLLLLGPVPHSPPHPTHFHLLLFLSESLFPLCYSVKLSNLNVSFLEFSHECSDNFFVF